MTLQIRIALAAANCFTAVSPGQNVALVGTSTARAGTMGGFTVVFAILVADLLWCLLALGIAIGTKEIDPKLLLTVQLASGLILLACGVKIVTETARKTASKQTGTQTRLGKLALQGFGVGFANPLTLVFFLTLFPALLPQAALHVDFTTATFYGSAILVSGFAALAPYVLASFALTKAGLGKALNIVSGGALVSIGGLVLVHPMM